jgi:ATP-dependent Lon protease
MKRVTKSLQEEISTILPIIPTMDVVVFPHMIVPLLILDEKIIHGINVTLQQEGKMVLLLASKKQSAHFHGTIGTKDLYTVGTVATIMRLIKIPDGGIKILVQGQHKARVDSLHTEHDMLTASVTHLDSVMDDERASLYAQEIKNIKHVVERMASVGNGLSPDFHAIINKMHDPEKIADFILSHINLSVDKSQELLEMQDFKCFLHEIYLHLVKECEISDVQERIKNYARDSTNQSHKEFYLREQLKAIKKELGEEEADEIEQLREKLAQSAIPHEAKLEVIRHINRLEKTSPDSMEATVLRNYLDCVLSLPWGKETVDNLCLKQARAILDEDHYGMQDIKERILDFISIKILKKDGTTPILCLYGPPGTGKTSLGSSIARSLGRECFRVSLGGVKDEAEIRGHRRTYVGAMPGRFMQGMRKVQSCNPVIIIDELDKIGADFRGDPSAAMLEVLDPHQNKAFYDNYLGIPFDLSKAIFIATANSLETISEPLRDRMEIIQLSSYTLEEKMNIAKRHLIKKSIMETGLEGHDVNFSDEVLHALIYSYTREAGVRELERLIKKMCAKVTRSLVEEERIPLFDAGSLEKYLGPRCHREEDGDQRSQIGICNGLAWTSVGGQMIKIETIMMPGKGKLLLTGQLGSVMKESAQAALSYARAHAQDFNIDPRIFTTCDLHIHVPAGGIPKDGPSAGVTMLTSILSALTQRKINASYAMTGELNLRGNIMAIGGVKEKILAAKRNGVTHIMLPEKNRQDIVGLEHLINDIQLIWIGHANEVINQVLLPIEIVA